ncbi:glycosyltransferase family 2 protein [Alicyclobacillus sp. TC]|uniref:Glycosyltransferase involved in cell wall biosynthesis n=1 Tax=Alicyclobacillus tolerans TaxID=90970 RepID=A0ABT9LSH5_9BACL|nr:MULTISPECIES: glycosyltransferase family 2 protein [Alicyclobacillus]MDP9727217.1 glycosyltransferase involved in cell wall biosynthesis [Alicyclobacillus tengchongensis]QRF22978.1 glycosyltransferase family 2 protein [Alicyclobacillus sp. TC]
MTVSKIAPKISILLCTYNHSSSLRTALQSVINQTFPDWECLVIDDGSTDETKQVLQSFQDSRITACHLEKNRGKSWALEQARNIARANIWIELDDDDWLAPEAAAKVFQYFSHLPEDVALLTSSYTLWSFDKARGMVYRRAMAAYPIFILPTRASVPIPRCYRRSAVEQARGWSEWLAYAEGRFFEDAFLTTVLLQQYQIARCNDVLYHRVLHRKSNSQQAKNLYSSLFSAYFSQYPNRQIQPFVPENWKFYANTRT